jgi:pyruvate/2-oxoglutarate dehydrogenase complex dihydrolipoamide acyltransferase (E2) component
MLKEIKMPDLGTTSDEILIVRWLKEEGEFVKRGEALLEVETDKSVMEVESYLQGYLKKILSPGDSTVVTGDAIALIGDEADVV